MTKRITLLVTLIFFSFSVVLFSGTTGKIKGKITDRDTKEPLIGANIILEGTSLGAATDLNGDYFIINVPPGKYTLIVSYIGYQRTRIVDVEVFVDRTLTRDVELVSSSYQTGEVVIIAQREKNRDGQNQHSLLHLFPAD